MSLLISYLFVSICKDDVVFVAELSLETPYNFQSMIALLLFATVGVSVL